MRVATVAALMETLVMVARRRRSFGAMHPVIWQAVVNPKQMPSEQAMLEETYEATT
jgi:hypothetical protein